MKKIFTKWSLLLLLLFMAFFSNAQVYQLKGKVVDASDEQPIPQVSIR